MGRARKPSAIGAFEDNIADAERLIQLTRALLNTRKRKMRRELRETYGKAMGMPQRSWDELDCVESNDVFVILKKGGGIRREHFAEPELRPLLRQAVVAIAAAVETYVSDKACSFIGTALDLNFQPKRLREIPIRLGEMLDIDAKYQRRRWGVRTVIESYVETEASPHPDKVGHVFSVVGKGDFWSKVDGHRKKRKGTSRLELEALADRRNRIAHTGDRLGSKRASLELSEVEQHLRNAKSIVEALEAVL